MTDLEQKLKQTYAERLDHLDLAGGDVGAARRAGTRLRARRRATLAVAAVAVVAVATGGSLLGTGRISIGPSDTHGDWHELPAPPLSPRAYAESTWTGRELIVLGGTSDPCPPNASCVGPEKELSDGAAFDPATDTWRSIADAPVPVGPGDRLLRVGARVLLRHPVEHGSAQWFRYDPTRDSWTPIDEPVGNADLPSAFGARAYVIAGRRVFSYDVASSGWAALPRDPITPRLTNRRVTATPYGPVVTGYEPQDGIVDFVSADVYDGTSWHRFHTNITGNDWAWVGDRMVDFDSSQHQGVDAGPQPGGQLDPATGRSGPLPESALETPEDPWSPNAVGPGPWAASWGLVYDVAHERAWKLPRPGGAPDLGVSAAWAGGRLLAFGGVGYGSGGADVTNRAWLYTP